MVTCWVGRTCQQAPAQLALMTVHLSAFFMFCHADLRRKKAAAGLDQSYSYLHASTLSSLLYTHQRSSHLPLHDPDHTKSALSRRSQCLSSVFSPIKITYNPCTSSMNQYSSTCQLSDMSGLVFPLRATRLRFYLSIHFPSFPSYRSTPPFPLAERRPPRSNLFNSPI